MTARRLPIDAPPVDGTATLDRETAHHAVRVLRLGTGDAVVLFDGAGGEWDGTVEAAAPRQVVVRTGPRRAVPRAVPAVDLWTAIPKGKRWAVLLRMATEAGVDRLRPIRAERTTVRPAGAAAREGAERRVREAARQSGRAWTPVLEPEAPLAERLAEPPAAGEVRLLATTADAPTVAAVLAAAGSDPVRVMALVGPEGGWTAAEDAAAREAGFRPCSLGPHVLRVETAAVAAVLAVRAATTQPPP